MLPSGYLFIFFAVVCYPCRRRILRFPAIQHWLLGYRREQSSREYSMKRWKLLLIKIDRTHSLPALGLTTKANLLSRSWTTMMALIWWVGPRTWQKSDFLTVVIKVVLNTTNIIWTVKPDGSVRISMLDYDPSLIYSSLAWLGTCHFWPWELFHFWFGVKEGLSVL
jgi:hypothetical protein